MDIVLFANSTNERAARFTHFLEEKNERPVPVAPGARLPTFTGLPGGAVYFDQGEPNLFELVAEARERIRYLGIALVVVTARELRAAGADLVCDPGTPDALLYKELSSRCQAREVDAEMRRQLADPLSAAVCQAIRQMTGMEATLQSVHRREQPAALGDIVVSLELTSAVPGLLVMNFSTATAQAFARQVFAEVHEEPTPTLVQDCMGEIANVVAGQAKALLHGTPYHFSFSPPLVQPAQAAKFPESMSSLVLAFDSDVGGCALQRCM
ncbi:MAG TPA: chemotaxis protein CheX [Gemmataceae bacterium]|nr:chemotaxis protein CheX [Gemmataceae bacterium]